MGKSRATSANQDTVVIRVTPGVLMGVFGSILGVILIGVVFWIGLQLGGGRNRSAAAQQPAYYPNQPAAPQPAPAQQPAVQQVQPSDQPVVAGRPAGAEVPIGDNPRLALPDLAASNYVLDFGETPPDAGPVTEQVTLRNDGVKDLIITDLQTNCNCTLVEVASRTVPPGGETQLSVTHDTGVMLGHGSTNIAHEVTISSNDPAAPVVAINTSGSITE